MAEKVIEIPDLLDPHLMELSVCGKVRTSKKSVLSRLQKLHKGRMTARTYSYAESDASVFAELFGGGQIKNHLHVNLVIRRSNWTPNTTALVTPSKMQTTLGQFVDLGADLIIRGEFLIAISKLSTSSFIRAAMKMTTINGTKFDRAGETFVAKPNQSVREIEWSYFGNDHVLVVVTINKSMKLNRDYLLVSKRLVVKSFQSIIISGKHNA